jgi:hypothetical protein
MGISKLEISKRLGIPEWRLRVVFNPSHYQVRSAREKTADRVAASWRTDPPADVLEERNRAYSKMSAGARLLGDPPPGRSALDRMNGG